VKGFIEESKKDSSPPKRRKYYYLDEVIIGFIAIACSAVQRLIITELIILE
jgi:hypothetical protein